MKANRSMPASTVIPVLAYPSLSEAVDWLCTAFGSRCGFGSSTTAPLNAGDGRVVVKDGGTLEPGSRRFGDGPRRGRQGPLQRAQAHGARIAMPPTDFPYGERRYRAVDFAGRSWTFSNQSRTSIRATGADAR